jgi:hypothetical protein
LDRFGTNIYFHGLTVGCVLFLKMKFVYLFVFSFCAWRQIIIKLFIFFVERDVSIATFLTSEYLVCAPWLPLSPGHLKNKL